MTLSYLLLLHRRVESLILVTLVRVQLKICYLFLIGLLALRIPLAKMLITVLRKEVENPIIATFNTEAVVC